MATFFDAVSESLKLIDNHSSFEFEALECEGSIGYYAFLAYMLIPALLCVVVFWCIVLRRSLWLKRLAGRPGIAYPMNILTRSLSLPFAACFGVIAPLVFKIVFETKQALEYTGPLWGRPFVTILSVIMYGTICFPIFTAVSLRQPLSYCLGSLYTWAFTALLVVEHDVCSMSTAARVTYTFQGALQFVCIAYLDVFLPFRFVQTVRQRVRTGTWQTARHSLTWERMRTFYQCEHVNRLLKRQVPPDETTDQSCSEKIKAFVKNWTYTRDDGFRYSSRILSIMWISFMVLYMTFIKIAWSITKLTQELNSVVTETLDEIGWEDQASDTELRNDTRTLLKAYHEATSPLWYLLMFCFTVAFGVGVVSILYILTSYRNNLKALYRGDYTHMSPRDVIGNVDIVTGSLRYAGYQVGYIIWAFVIQSVCLFLAIVLVVAVAAALTVGSSTWLLELLQYLGPWLGLFLLILLLQYLAAKYAFLQDHEQSVSIDNRRALFALSYYMFFYNVFVSIASCLLRLGKSMGLGILLISRLDHSLLPRKFELGDTGFSRYSGFMHLECYHTHPCMQTFVLILTQCRLDTQQKLLGSPAVASTDQSTGQYLMTLAMSLLGLERTRSNKVSSEGQAQADDITDGQAERETRPVQMKEHTWYLENPKGLELVARNNRNSLAPQSTINGSESLGQCVGAETNMAGYDVSMSSAVEAAGSLQGGSGDSDPWGDLRDSDTLREHRRRQRAAFRWFLLYTLHFNPQLIIERKGFLHRKRSLYTKTAAVSTTTPSTL